jgi:hypothetical protein
VKRRTSWHEGEAIVFKRETWSQIWEPGTYLSVDADCHGWHYVRDANGFRQYLPTRRIRETLSGRAESLGKVS